jgi:large subunit ribosomal protein L9
MKIILKQDINNLGEEGDIKEVADGYARNYLIPKKMAVVYGPAAINELERRREAIAKRKEEKRLEARSFKEKIEAEELIFSVAAGEKKRLFGAITAANIVEELAKKNITVERKKVDVPESIIKTLGSYTVRVRLYGDETASLKVTVEANAESKAKEEKAEKKQAKARKEAAAEENTAETASENE